MVQTPQRQCDGWPGVEQVIAREQLQALQVPDRGEGVVVQGYAAVSGTTFAVANVGISSRGVRIAGTLERELQALQQAAVKLVKGWYTCSHTTPPNPTNPTPPPYTYTQEAILL
jgi:hypothetical protein